jgi:hypothetical protein
MIFDGDIIRATKGPGKGSYELNLGAIYRLEARQAEAQGVGMLAARELMNAMKEGSRLTGEAAVFTRLEQDRAKAALKLRTGIVNMDVAPGVLEAKKTLRKSSPGGTAEQLESVLVRDQEFQELQDYVFQLNAIVGLLDVKLNGFRNTYFTIQKAFEERSGGQPLEPVSGPVRVMGTSPLNSPLPSFDSMPEGGVVHVDGGPYQHQTTGQSNTYTETHTRAVSVPPVVLGGILIGKGRY